MTLLVQKSYHLDLYRKTLSNSDIYNYTVLKKVSAIGKPGSAFRKDVCLHTPVHQELGRRDQKGQQSGKPHRRDIFRKL